MSQSYCVCNNCLGLNRVDLDRAQQRQPVCGKCSAELPFHDGLCEATGATLEKLVAKSPLPVIVDFWAPWCGPCVGFAPTFAATAREMAGRAVFVKVNTQNDPAAGASHAVRGIPTLITFRNGRESDRVSGAMPQPHFRQWAQEQLG